MKSYTCLFFLFISILLISAPANAAILNISVVTGYPFQKILIDSGEVNSYSLNLQTGGYIAGGYGGFGGSGAGGRSGDLSSTSGTVNDYNSRVIAEQIINYQKENSRLDFVYTRVDGSTISGYVILVPSGLFSGTRTLHINENGFTQTTDYSRDPTGSIIYAESLYTFVSVDACTNMEYFVISDGSIMGTGVINLWDNTTKANLPISGISSNPIYKCTFTTHGLQTFRINTAAVKLVDYKASRDNARCNSLLDVNQDPLSLLDWMLDPLRGVIQSLQDFAAMLATSYAVMWAIGAFIFSAQVFIGANCVYIVIAAWFSVDHASINNPFGIGTKFIAYMRTLMRFYREIFLFIKELIVWW